MGKVTWTLLGEIYEKQFGVTAEEASDIISKHLFSDTSWKGKKGSLGRMWKAVGSRVALVCLVREHQRLKKINYHNSTRKLFNSPEFNTFCIEASVVYKQKNGFHQFQKDFAHWKQLPEVKHFYIKNDTYTKKVMRRVKKLNDTTAAIFADNEKRMKAEGRIQQPDGSWKPHIK